MPTKLRVLKERINSIKALEAETSEKLAALLVEEPRPANPAALADYYERLASARAARAVQEQSLGHTQIALKDQRQTLEAELQAAESAAKAAQLEADVMASIAELEALKARLDAASAEIHEAMSAVRAIALRDGAKFRNYISSKYPGMRPDSRVYGELFRQHGDVMLPKIEVKKPASRSGVGCLVNVRDEKYWK